MAGSYAGKNLGDKAANVEKQNREAFKKGGYGKEEYAKQQVIKQVWENDDIYGIYGRKNKAQFEEEARVFVDNGITDSNEIIAAMKMRNNYNKEMEIERAKIENDNTLTRDEKDEKLKFKQNISNSDAVTVAQLNQKISNRSFGDPTKRERFRKDIETSLTRQGYQGNVREESFRQIRLISDLKTNIDSL